MTNNNKENAQALLSLLATEAPMTEDCLSEEQLSAYIDGVLEPSQVERVQAHLNHCPDCYQSWLEIADIKLLMEQESELPAAAAAPASNPVESWLARWQQSWKQWFYPAMATACCLGFALVVWLPNSQLNQAPLDQMTQQLQQTVSPSLLSQHPLPLPWEHQAMSFHQSGASIESQAFGGGLWQSQRDMQVSGVAQGANPFLPQEECCWEKTQWKAQYELGRWAGLLWWKTQWYKSLSDADAQAAVSWNADRLQLTAYTQALDSDSIASKVNIQSLAGLQQALSEPVDVVRLENALLNSIHLLGPAQQ